MRGAWLAAGAVVTVFALVLSTALIYRGVARARTPEDTTERSIPFTYQELRVKAAKGDVSVTITPGQAGELYIRRSLRWSGDRPTVTEDWDARTRTLRLEAVCHGSDQPGGPICRADYMLSVPPETDVEADTAAGWLGADDLFGDVRLSSVSGEVSASGLSGTFWARTGTGGVHAERLKGERADVEVGAGNVMLDFLGAPTSVKAVVRTRGDINVKVPPALYDVSTEGANTAVNVERAPGSDRKITLRALNGIVNLCCR
ncbi:hypothetical protein [Nonomuraea sp. NPDC050643]|uniref:hypothetical protein n=1 Tax=Nonomuraea sp. NPDC050643 TaxID=3155660 RepID=UPI00340F2CAB